MTGKILEKVLGLLKMVLQILDPITINNKNHQLISIRKCDNNFILKFIHEMIVSIKNFT